MRALGPEQRGDRQPPLSLFDLVRSRRQRDHQAGGHERPRRLPRGPAAGLPPERLPVTVLADGDEAERAATTPREAGSADQELRTSTPQQILDDDARDVAQESLPRRVVTASTDDQDTLDLYPGFRRRPPT